MGCAQAKPSVNLSSPQGLQRLMMENGYSKGKHVEARRSSGGRSGSSHGGTTGEDGKLSSRESRKDSRGSSSSSGGGGGGGGDVGSISKRITSWNLSGEDELVNGWPKWLTDNIPKEVLAGIVPKSADSYDKIDKIGEGTYSNVYKARDRETGKIVALKKVRFDTSEPESIKFMAREIMMLQKLDHPNIIKLEGLATSRMQYSLYLVFDYMQSDLSSIISRTDQRLTEPQVKCYMKQLLSGLAHCHERGILHRDIKGSNLLIDKKGVLKIADLGLANHFDINKKQRLTSRVVTLWYRAPELLLGSTDYGPGIDLWSAGCLVAEMFIGRPIMPGRTEVEQLHRIFKLCGSPPEEYWKKLKVSSTFRPPHSYKSSLREVFRDFPPSALRLLNILLALDSRFRGTAASALQHEFFHTNPLPCDLSGLPVIYKEEDEALLAHERRRIRNPKMRRRSKTQRDRHKTDLQVDKPTVDSAASKEEPEKISELDLLVDSGATSPSMKQDQKEGIITPPPFLSPEETSQPRLYSEAYASAITNLPPLPNGKQRTFKSRNDDDGKYSSSRVQRSVSTREYRKLDQNKLLKLHAVDDL